MRKDHLTAEQQLARLADATLAEGERAALEEAVAGSPELAAALEEQQRAMSLVRAIDARAPAALHASVAALDAPAVARWSRWELMIPAGLAAGVALVAVVLVLAAPGRQANVVTTAHLALSRATFAAPAQSETNHAALATTVDGVAFPDWQARGWQATGARRDSLGDHTVKTVFYVSVTGTRVGYSIAAGAALPVGGGRTVAVQGVRFTVIDADGATIVTWLRGGHTCVLASRGAGPGALLKLADSTEYDVAA
jgi:hypothetical protein